MKTPLEIINEISPNRPWNERGKTDDMIIRCMIRYHNQFLELNNAATPTESEINEAATDAMMRTDQEYDGESDYINGFKECVKWLQNYQTQGSEKPVENSLLIDACKYGYEYHAKTQFPEMSFEENCKNNFLQHSSNWQASQPNPAIAVIEAEMNELKINGGLRASATILVLETILKKIKGLK
ncbi:hypothetical protein [Mucilaginibacter endophyticus]|uniref:hypothetical protein n=1 Tax=Mucilaginibacter endophyticus TaxID=2675003 RepID=UPI000E0DD6E1|nr:hypothetical protein [Mucilaginibacter endophyticus]